MVDVVDSETRSRMMSGIRGKDTKPELLIRSLLHRRGFRFRLHVKNMPGKPDLVLRRYGAVILIHGCFWHGHDCPAFKWPSSRVDFWRTKILRNQENDRKAKQRLAEMGWRVLTIWECAMRDRIKNPEVLADRIDIWLVGGRGSQELSGRAGTREKM